MRRTIETRFFESYALFDIEQLFARGPLGLQLRIAQILLTYNLSYFDFN
ncbi:hypothetical protein HO944_01495 [Streptococcus suis]|uniref:Transposase n=2 Tax=Streptococcus suis TaxID=1307 RepID=A0A116L0U2_STRSU|nr:hypothetical protein [Streptococcus suis]MBY4635437.1 hypothetical protein [Streptococcus suis]NQO88238.1 hypothetical protein [Streptococcus suis]CYU66706.1 transposase [Streptococcus suis]CYX98648.1 transposase [Streptococcus suis]HEL9642955.1 hypothetical protein [Streptococcus suis]